MGPARSLSLNLKSISVDEILSIHEYIKKNPSKTQDHITTHLTREDVKYTWLLPLRKPNCLWYEYNSLPLPALKKTDGRENFVLDIEVKWESDRFLEPDVLE